MAKRTKFEAGGNEDDYIRKCMRCKGYFEALNIL